MGQQKPQASLLALTRYSLPKWFAHVGKVGIKLQVRSTYKSNMFSEAASFNRGLSLQGAAELSLALLGQHRQREGQRGRGEGQGRQEPGRSIPNLPGGFHAYLPQNHSTRPRTDLKLSAFLRRNAFRVGWVASKRVPGQGGYMHPPHRDDILEPPFSAWALLVLEAVRHVIPNATLYPIGHHYKANQDP